MLSSLKVRHALVKGFCRSGHRRRHDFREVVADDAAKTSITRDPILVDLALQGGGSHGAFTWGVLDRLLEEPWLGIDGISGTSAGAMNAAVLVDGHAKGGAPGARTALENFWRRVSEAARFSPLRRGPLDVISVAGRWTLRLSMSPWISCCLVSPYDLNPMGKNRSRSILAETINFERLAQAPTKLFITATNVRTGHGYVFKNNAVTPDVLLASACFFRKLNLANTGHVPSGPTL